jgi:3-(3-hydroxy-phenyl)propionate hydroxylase
MRAFQPYPFTAQKHPAHHPSTLVKRDTQRHPVVIVGGGIAGLTSALALAAHGVRSVVLEADDTVCTGSRAICVSRRSLEILARLDALEPFLRTGLSWTGGRSFYGNADVLRFAMPNDGNQRLPPMINIQQYYIEQFLLDAVERTGLVDIRWQARAQAILPSPDHVRVEVEVPSGAYALEAEWVLGCDGARSLVREAAGLMLEGTSYEGRYVIVDVALRSDRPTERLAWFDPPSNPGSTILMHRQPGDVWRIDYQLRDGEDPNRAVLPENVIPRVASHLRMIGERDDWAPIWISLYKANALTLKTYRIGRLLLAGDAAHLVPIFGVRGANSAFEDADNLAWKLALVIRGAAPDGLLDSYSVERVHAARENLRQGMRSTEFMSPPSFGFHLMRTAVLGLAVDDAFVRTLINPRQTQAIAYPDTSLNGPSVGMFEDGPDPGSVALECPVTGSGAQGRTAAGYLTELVPPCFTALCFTQSGELAAGWRTLGLELERRGVPFTAVAIARERPAHCAYATAWDHTGRTFPLYGAEPGTVYLLRPDGYVAARWQRGSPDAVRQAVEHMLHAPRPRLEVKG